LAVKGFFKHIETDFCVIQRLSFRTAIWCFFKNKHIYLERTAFIDLNAPVLGIDKSHFLLCGHSFLISMHAAGGKEPPSRLNNQRIYFDKHEKVTTGFFSGGINNGFVAAEGLV
jgi:hypothetical protein